MERISSWFFLLYCCCCCITCMTTASFAAQLFTNTSTSNPSSTDQSALLALKARITSDPQNMILSNWSTNTPVCNWVGVTCSARHRRVAALNLSSMGLTATIPPQLGNLSFLVDLDLTNNSFHDPLPKELAHLHRLKFIRLRFNNFMGIIPSWFGSLSKLQIFDLYGNRFSGSIPTTISNLSAILELDVSYNNLSGSIPREVGNLTMLKRLYLDDNHFRDIPKEIGMLDQLERLFVQDNALTGDLPSAIFNMSSLIDVTFYGNNLNGSLPDNICQHLPSIQSLNFNFNLLMHGPVPSKLWQCQQLVAFQLGSNKFSGSIPTSIANLTQIRFLRLFANNLIGTIPQEIGHLPNLQILEISDNNFIGPVPSSVFNMSTMGVLTLSSNLLSGSLPENIDLPNLQVFFAGGNKFTGVIPKSISNSSELRKLDMAGNFFSGSVPSTLCSLKKLQLLSFSDSNLEIDTSIPGVNIVSCLATLEKLRILDLSSIQLNADLSISFRNLSTSLEQLYLRNCSMRGHIPLELGNLSELGILDIQKNQLSGSIPTSIGRLQNLQGMYLNDNKLQGYIPDEICQLKNVADLFLDGNQLSGSIPSCFGHLAPTIRTLSLASNLLNSTIPSTLWGFTDVLVLNLSSNSLVGPLSEGVGNLKVVTNLDLSNNHLSGTIPSTIQSLQSLLQFSLANNNFEGPIPSSLGNLQSLEQLDLSKNKLSGEIPKSLEALSYLQYLNLSFNRLQGEIPVGGHFKNFSDEFFASNDELCGASRLLVPPCQRKTSRSILKYVIPGILSAMLLVVIIWMLILRQQSSNIVAKSTTAEIAFFPHLEWRRISYHELFSATNGFNASNLLGTGAFGSVYKGTLPDGMNVAIKVFNTELERAFKSFEVECEMLSNICHRNLIKVISCCSQIDFKAIVLNYMPKGSLDKWLYSHNFSLSILQRLDISIDVASALEYLHHGYETPIVHCDLKPGNILLDDRMSAHVADFGIAKLLGERDSMTQTMTLATIGYMAPEYGTGGIVTRRGDVYSFGIVLMETFTRRKPTDEIFTGDMSLKQWVANSLYADALVEVLDANLYGTKEDHVFASEKECLTSIMRLALSCCLESPEDRINMQEALATLNKIKIKFLKDATGDLVLNVPSS